MTVQIDDDNGLYAGQVYFRDKNYAYCTTSGTLSVKREEKEYVKKLFEKKCTTCFSEEVEEAVPTERPLHSVRFSSKDFEYSGETSFLPIHFKAGEVESGDKLIFEWRSFRVVKKVR